MGADQPSAPNAPRSTQARRSGSAPPGTLAHHTAEHRLYLSAISIQHLETERGNSAATRNARRAALRSFFSYASYRAPDAIATISQVLAIPAKRTKTTLVSFLAAPEAEALIAAPDTRTWLGRRDRLLLHLGIQTGLRVSELVNLRVGDLQLGPHSQLECVGKGRKQRVIPLQKNTLKLVTAWLAGARGAAVPDQQRDHADQSRSRQARRPSHRDRDRMLPEHRGEERHAAHAATHVRDEPAARRDRHRQHRALARTREHPDHADLPPRRPRTQTTNPGTRPRRR